MGSARVLTDASGSIAEQLDYDSFGNSAGTPTTGNSYTGRERDDVTGLMYYRARFYDPQVGRFTSQDPIGFAGGTNHFGYVGNNPLNSVDSLGLQPGPTNYLRDPFPVDEVLLNAASNSLSDGLGLDGVAQESWDLGNPCLSNNARAWAGGKLAGRVILVATGGPILRGIRRSAFGALEGVAPGLASRASGPISELLTSGTAAKPSIPTIGGRVPINSNMLVRLTLAESNSPNWASPTLILSPKPKFRYRGLVEIMQETLRWLIKQLA